MDIRYSITDVIKDEIDNSLTTLYTSIPAIVESYNETAQTVNVKVAVETPTVFGDNIPPAEYKEIPVMFPSASNWSISGPIDKGDSVVLLVPHYGTEEYRNGNKNKVGKPKYVNKFDLNDAVAFVGMFTNKPTINQTHKDKFNISQGNNVITLDDTGGININTSSGSFSITPSGEIAIIGNLTITGNLNVTGITNTLGLVANGIDQVLHTHTYTDDGNPLVTGPAQ